MANNKIKEEASPQQKTTIVLKALGGRASELDRDELLDVIFWYRQLIGILMGSISGVLKLKGAPVVIAFGVFLFGATYMFYRRHID
jgi:hypothetical protein